VLEGLFWFSLDVDGFDSLFSGRLDEASVGGEEDVALGLLGGGYLEGVGLVDVGLTSE